MKRKIIKLLVLLIIFSILVILYARFIGTKGLVIKEYSIVNEKIPESFDRIKIVQFSDLYYGSTIFIEQLENVVNAINEWKPDIVFFTGDLIEEGYQVENEEQE